MKCHLVLVMFIVFAVSSSGQTLTFKESAFELGDIDNIKPVSRDVHYENTGDKELVIDRVKTSCGCTSSKLEKKVLQPNESGTLKITFNPAGRKGKQVKKVTFFSNDLNEKDKAISFTANVVPVWDITPRRIEFKQNVNGEGYAETSKSFIIDNLGKESIMIDSITGSNENFIIAGPADKEILAGSKKEISISIEPNFKPEKYTSSNIQVKVKIGDDSANRSVRVVVRPIQLTKK